MAKTTERERAKKKQISRLKKTKFMFYHIKRSCFCVLLDWIWRFSWHFTTLFLEKKPNISRIIFVLHLTFFLSVLCLVLNDWHEMILDYERFFILLNDFVKRHYRRNFEMRVVCVCLFVSFYCITFLLLFFVALVFFMWFFPFLIRFYGMAECSPICTNSQCARRVLTAHTH